MIAAAFNAVSFPIRPVIQRSGDGEVRLYKRNPRVFTPKDFDYSPYFDVIKCPFPGFDDLAIYRQLPWGHDSIVCHEDGDRRLSPPLGLRTAPRSDAESIHARSADRHPLDDAPGDRRATGGATES
ncbi:MAG: hypothetical protein GWO02_16690 [Gammaproteobacteria bacterium]|nr:hypothetical protein [Gammaproteobacteria bacterium]